MKAQDYLQNLLENCSKYENNEHDEKLLRAGSIEEYIQNKLLSSKFRKWKASEGAKERVKKAVELAVANKEPVKILFLQGAYKLWRFPTSPEVDWAEFFNLGYMINYVSSILKNYEYGVEIGYLMHKYLPEIHDNLTSEETQSYIDSFNALIDEFSEYYPKNLKIKVYTDELFYKSRDDLENQLLESYEDGEKEFMKIDEEKRNGYYLYAARLNLKLDGRVNLTKLSKDELDKRVEKGAIMDFTLSNFVKKHADFRDDPKNVLIFSVGSDKFLGLGTSKTSMVKHWTGTGVLAEDKASFKDYILSPNQFERIQSFDQYKEQIDLIRLKNFKEITVLKDLPNFSNKS